MNHGCKVHFKLERIDEVFHNYENLGKSSNVIIYTFVCEQLILIFVSYLQLYLFVPKYPKVFSL